MQSIINWFKKPYYFNDDNRFKFIISFGLGFFTFLFLVILKPAGATPADLKMNPYLFRLVYGIISTSILLFYFFVFTKLFPRYYKNELWTTGKHLLNILGIMLTCGIINATYSKWALSENFYGETGFLDIIFKTISYGVLPTLIYIYFDEKHQLKKARSITKNIMETTKLKNSSRLIKNSSEQIKIFASNKKDSLSFKLNNLVYVTSDTNYACFYIKEKDNNLKEHILRLPLRSVQTHLEEFENIVRCHKSFIINSNYVKRISGNARGYSLHIKELSKTIPVSRRFSHKELENLVSA